MTGNKRFILEYDETGAIVRVWSWAEWVKLPLFGRTWEAEMVEARDELDAYIKGANNG